MITLKRALALLSVTALLVIASCTPASGGGTPAPVVVRYGFTVEAVPSIPNLVAAAQASPYRLTIRFVFQVGDPAVNYLPAVQAVSPYADIIGLFLDSTGMQQTPQAAWQARVDQYLNLLGAFVGTWEVGNEINGEWVDEGTSAATAQPAKTTAKVVYAFNAVKAAGLKTALTLMYQPNCGEWPANEMFTWAAANIPSNILQGVDHLWISYYEDVCNNQQFTDSQWETTFQRLKGLGGTFPLLGFGETGYSATNKTGPNNPRLSNSAKIALMNRYYDYKPSTTIRFEGQYLWWYGQQDFLPIAGNPLWANFVSKVTS